MVPLNFHLVPTQKACAVGGSRAFGLQSFRVFAFAAHRAGDRGEAVAKTPRPAGDDSEGPIESLPRGLLIKDQDRTPLVASDEVYVNFHSHPFVSRAWIFKEVSLSQLFVRVQVKKDWLK
jgi:hypothetical protein